MVKEELYKGKKILITYGQYAEPPEIDTLIYAPEVNWRYDTQKKRTSETHTIFKLYQYKHGDIKLSTDAFSCRWDSCFIGYCFYPKELSKTWKEAKKLIERDMEILTKYLNGEVYEYNIYELCKCCSQVTDYLSGCGSYYDQEHCLNSAKEEIDNWKD